MPGTPATSESSHDREVVVVRRVDCSHGIHAVDAVRSLAGKLRIAVRVKDVVIHGDDEARALGCLGSPTVLVGGLDVEPAARAQSSFGAT